VDGVFSKDTVTVGNIDVAFQLFAEVRNVSKIIDELVATLKAEQIADDDKKDYCEVEFDKAEDKTKSLLQGESDLEASKPLTRTWTKFVLVGVRQQFVRDIVSEIERTVKGKLTYATMTNVVEEVAERFGHFQDAECGAMSCFLIGMGDGGIGRVPLAEFYKTLIEGATFEFQENEGYLRELPVFAFYLQLDPDAKGEFTFGGMDPADYIGDLVDVTLTSEIYWEVELTDMIIGNNVDDNDFDVV